jgi:hypothetical protein
MLPARSDTPCEAPSDFPFDTGQTSGVRCPIRRGNREPPRASYPEHDLFIQQTKLKHTLRHWLGEERLHPCAPAEQSRVSPTVPNCHRCSTPGTVRHGSLRRT